MTAVLIKGTGVVVGSYRTALQLLKRYRLKVLVLWWAVTLRHYNYTAVLFKETGVVVDIYRTALKLYSGTV